MFKKFQGVISTDFSVYADMTMPMVQYNSYRNKLLASWWQKSGIPVIPNVSWSREWSYDFCFEGFPKNSVIAINSTGTGRDKFSKSLWMKGYEQAIKTLQPSHIIRYGVKHPGEWEEISTYFINDNTKFANNGR